MCFALCFLQCLCYESLVLTAESTIVVYGFIREVPEGKTVGYVGGR